MAKKTTVSIYQVDSSGVTGAHVGEGSLVGPRYVLVHPPLNERIAAGFGTSRLRVGIWSEANEDRAVEIVDGWQEARVIGEKDGVGSLVGLELRTAVRAPVDVMKGLGNARSVQDVLDIAVPVLKSNDPNDWNTEGPHEPRIGDIVRCLLFNDCG